MIKNLYAFPHVGLTKLQPVIMLSTSNGFISGCGYNSVSLKEKKITQTSLNVANQAFSKLD